MLKLELANRAGITMRRLEYLIETGCFIPSNIRSRARRFTQKDLEYLVLLLSMINEECSAIQAAEIILGRKPTPQKRLKPEPGIPVVCRSCKNRSFIHIKTLLRFLGEEDFICKACAVRLKGNPYKPNKPKPVRMFNCLLTPYSGWVQEGTPRRCKRYLNCEHYEDCLWKVADLGWNGWSSVPVQALSRKNAEVGVVRVGV